MAFSFPCPVEVLDASSFFRAIHRASSSWNAFRTETVRSWHIGRIPGVNNSAISEVVQNGTTEDTADKHETRAAECRCVASGSTAAKIFPA